MCNAIIYMERAKTMSIGQGYYYNYYYYEYTVKLYSSTVKERRWRPLGKEGKE